MRTGIFFLFGLFSPLFLPPPRINIFLSHASLHNVDGNGRGGRGKEPFSCVTCVCTGQPSTTWNRGASERCTSTTLNVIKVTMTSIKRLLFSALNHLVKFRKSPIYTYIQTHQGAALSRTGNLRIASPVFFYHQAAA